MATISIPPVRDSALVFVPATVSVQLTAPDGSPVIGALGTTLPTEYTSVAIPPAGVLLTLEPQAQIAIPYGFATWYEITITSAHLTEVYRVQVDDVLSPQDLRSLKGVAGITPVAIGAEPALTTASQAEMEAGTVTALRSMTPQRVAQAIQARTYQDFTASGTWTKPVGPYSTVMICLTGGGGGGGAGARRASGTASSGGAGGASGAVNWLYLAYADLPASVAVIVGAGGLGGAATATDDTDGAAGGSGGNAEFGPCIALRGNGGGGGKAGAVSVGGIAYNGISPGATGMNGSSGGAGISGGIGYLWSASGGASGGGVSATPAAYAGGPGGMTAWTAMYGVLGIALGGDVGAAGGDGAASDATVGPFKITSGASGGGGGSSLTGAGGRGGHAGNYGAAGGGGGSSLNGFASGAGGNGSGGRVQVWVW